METELMNESTSSSEDSNFCERESNFSAVYDTRLTNFNLCNDKDTQTGTDAAHSIFLTNDSLKWQHFMNSQKSSFVVIRILDRHILSNTFSVTFFEDSFRITFTVSKESVAERFGGTTKCTFNWEPKLFAAVNPQLSYRQGQELFLKMAVPKNKWPYPFKLSDCHNSIHVPTADVNDNLKLTERSECNSVPNVAPRLSEDNCRNSHMKPVCKVSPFEHVSEGVAVKPGYTGLRNIGNTCFMNAILQLLVNCQQLRHYFIKDNHLKDINQTNPLGFGGRLAICFGNFMKAMWNGKNDVLEPTELKSVIAEKATQFASFAQHDAHEFLSFLLDGLHEDLNRVRDRSLIADVRTDLARSDFEASELAWKRHVSRTNSVIVDLFHGQLKSRLQCPFCDKVSTTFDPFVYLPLPFPRQMTKTNIVFWPTDPYTMPIKIRVEHAVNGLISDVLQAVAAEMHTSPKNLRLCDIFSNRILKVFPPTDRCIFRSNDLLYVFEIFDAEREDEEVVTMNVTQRLLCRSDMTAMCGVCRSVTKKLHACQRCFDSLYCGINCQKFDWDCHKIRCGTKMGTVSVGQPFILSVKKSQASYENLVKMIEARCSYSVEVFQMPNFETSSIPTASHSSFDPYQKPPITKIKIGEKENESSRSKVERAEALFLLRQCDERMITAASHYTLKPSTGELQWSKLKENSFLTVNWCNKKFGRDFLNVETKFNLDPMQDNRTHMNLDDFGQQDTVKLEDMVQLFSATERLSAEESWHCDKCKSEVEATKSLRLYRLPSLLLIQLKRFVYCHHQTAFSIHRRTKDERSVIYPLRGLDMSGYVCEAGRCEDSLYDLVGVVCHSGTSYYGHYVTIAAHQTGTRIEWLLFDDSSVRPVKPIEVVRDDAYLLLYKRRQTVTR